MINLTKVMKTLFTQLEHPSFEQFKDVYTSLGISATYDDLRTNSSASSSLKKQSGKFSEISGRYGFSYDTRDRSFMPRSGGVTKFSQSCQSLLIANMFQIF